MRLFRYYTILWSLLLGMACQSTNTSDSHFEQWYEQTKGHCSIWIKGGLVYNGIDTIPTKRDILINGDSISYLGEVLPDHVFAKKVIAADGMVVTPGFIDPHAHGNPIQTPSFHNFLRMGVTTVCLGQDGSSPQTTDLDGWLNQVADTIPGVNIAYFVGHGTLRHLSGIGFQTDPSPTQLQKMGTLLQSAFRAGAWGMSTGLEYTPGVYADEEELIYLAKIVGQHQAIIMSHVRNEDDNQIINSLQELLVQGQYANVHVAHLKVVYGKGEKRGQEILTLLTEKKDSSFRVSADMYPYTASYTGIGIVFPKWAKPPNDYEQIKATRREELLQYLSAKIYARNGPEATLFGTKPYAGQSLAEVSQQLGIPFEEVLLHLGPSGASGAYFIMDEALQTTFLKAPQVIVGSDGSPTMFHPRGYGTFAKIIRQYVLTEKVLNLGEAICKMTGRTAKIIGLTNRGYIQKGCKADILVFNPSFVKDNATFTNPRLPANGFDWVIINGRLMIENGKMDTLRWGKVLRK